MGSSIPSRSVVVSGARTTGQNRWSESPGVDTVKAQERRRSRAELRRRAYELVSTWSG